MADGSSLMRLGLKFLFSLNRHRIIHEIGEGINHSGSVLLDEQKRLVRDVDPHMNTHFLRALLFLMTLVSSAQAVESFGLTVGKNGALLLEGKPFRGVGINFAEPLLRYLVNPDDPSVAAGFATCKKYEIPFVRLIGSGWSGPGMKLYEEDREEYFCRLDKVVEVAEQNEVGIILSLFWTPWPAEVNGEKRLAAWIDPVQKTHQTMSQYVKEVVERYRGSRAVWGWEYGNEVNLLMDLPNRKDFDILPEHEFTHARMREIYVAFGKEVRRFDPHRWIDTGASLPRPSSWHQIQEDSWTEDSLQQMAEILAADNPHPINAVSVHCYEPHDLVRLSTAAKVAKKLKKPLFVGEFGVAGPRNATTEKQFRDQLTALDREQVPLAAVWELDPSAADRLKWSIREDNDRVYMLDLVRNLNRKWRSE